MTFQDDDGNVIDFDGEFAITKQSVSVFGFKIRGDVSVNFNLDNNSVNRKILGYQGPQMLNQIAWTKQPFSRIKNGNIIDRGYIVIQRDLGDKLDCFYASGNANWVGLFNNLITDLDFTGVTNGIDYGLGSFSIITNTATTGMGWNIIDGRYNLKLGTASFDEWPVFYMHSLLLEIMKQSQIKYEGPLLDDRIFKTMILPPINGHIKNPDSQKVYGYGVNQVISDVESRYTSITSESDLFNCLAIDGSSPLYTSNQSAALLIYVSVTCVEPTTISIVSTRGGSTGTVINGNTDVWVNHKLVPGNTDQVYNVYNGGILLGEGIDIYVKSNTPATTPNFRINVVRFEVPENYVTFATDDLGGGGLIYPNWILPSLKKIDIIKFLTYFFGCSLYFDSVSKTLKFNIIDKIKKESSPDWSDYFVDMDIDYTIDTAQNNYFRVGDSDDTYIKSYNRKHTTKYGDSNIETENTLTYNNEIYQSPFSASQYGKGINGVWTTYIPLITLRDAGDPAPFTSITNAAGNARITGAIGAFNFIGDGALSKRWVRIVNNTNDIGYFFISVWDTVTFSWIECDLLYYTATGTGSVYLQSPTFNDVNPRVLIAKTGVSVREFSDTTTLSSTYTTLPISAFAKPITGLPVDAYDLNCAFDNPDIIGFTEKTAKDLYHKNIESILKSPKFKVMMLLPEAEFQSFDFSNFIYLKTKGLTGYFFIDSIVNYKDSGTPVEVNLYMV